jgi:hypothetical protein
VEYLSLEYFLWAFALGAISAASLPLGLQPKLRPGHISMLAALLEDLAAIPLLKYLPPEHVNTPASVIWPVIYKAGDVVAREGGPAAELTFFVGGTVDAFRQDGAQSELGPSIVMGVIPLVMERPQVASLTVKVDITGYSISTGNGFGVSCYGKAIFQPYTKTTNPALNDRSKEHDP